ncbi:LOW QUALITY PROTEIN: protein NYNRIN-like [Rhinophrynus dorsalis]
MNLHCSWQFPVGDHSAQYAEIQALSFAMKEALLGKGPILIVTDSAYLARSIAEDLCTWKSNGFLNARRKPLTHIGKWKEISAYLSQKPDIEIVHEPAHRKLGSSVHTLGNQYADSLAQDVSQRFAVNTVTTRSKTRALNTISLDAELNACLDKSRPNPPGYPKKHIYALRDGQCFVTINDHDFILPPVHERVKIAMNAHNSIGHPHLGRYKVLVTLKQKYWWPNMTQTVCHVIGNCKPCLLTNNPNHQSPPYIVKEIPNKPFDLIYLDHIGPLPSSQGYKYVLVCVDACTRFTWLYPVRSATSNTTLKCLNSLASIGKPRAQHSDGGPAFTAKVSQEWENTYGIKWEISTPNHPQSSGVMEKNAEVKRFLTKLLSSRPTQWYPLLTQVQIGLNNIPSSVNNKTPYEMLYGIPMHTDFTPTNISAPGRLEQLTILQELRDYFSKPAHTPTQPLSWKPDVGHYVQEKVQTAKPLRPRWKPPVCITAKFNDRTFITMDNSGRQRTISIDNLKPASHFNPTAEDDIKKSRSATDILRMATSDSSATADSHQTRCTNL